MAASAESVISVIVKMALDMVSSPLNIALVGVIMLLIYKLVIGKRDTTPAKSKEPELPKMKKRDFTLEQLQEFDGRGPSGRVLIAVNGKVFDVTRGKKFYGPDGPYSAFAGRDASRGLATFSVEITKDEYDDLSDLNSMQMESVREWEMQFKEKYDYVGRLLKPGEEPNEYSDEEDSMVSTTKTDIEEKKTPEVVNPDSQEKSKDD